MLSLNLSLPIIIIILSAGIAAATPVLLAALGEIICERAGVMNLGQEGIMITGCVVSFLITVLTHSKWLGLLAGIIVCAVLGLLHAFLTITLKGNQIVSGLAMVVFGTGLSSLIGKPVIGMPIPDSFSKISLPILSRIPLIGDIFFTHDIITYFGLLLVPLLWFWLFRTRSGLYLRAVGESPHTADSLGINIIQTRYLYVVFGSILTGIGGAYLTLSYTPAWIEGMSAGKGWIAIAVVVFAMWNPARAFLGAYLYGMVHALGFRMQALGVSIPSEFINMLPYLVPIVVLLIVARRTRNTTIGPSALGIPYDRESR